MLKFSFKVQNFVQSSNIRQLINTRTKKFIVRAESGDAVIVPAILCRRSYVRLDSKRSLTVSSLTLTTVFFTEIISCDISEYFSVQTCRCSRRVMSV